MKYLNKTPEELDKELDEFQFTYNVKSVKKNNKTTVIAKGVVKSEDNEEELSAQSTKETWLEAFEEAIEKLNKKAEDKDE